ncbi:histidine kinase dimerization/phospho-acceptor domain-containing protein [Telmatospirillum sp. J64-1]|uniref:sensor histidine kinase n=1 Tax=Telmatospirillum sp. J64-1 TaxID=2502183 RepID=UPI00163D7BEB|nr:histidine kinase dimerization/phospho-acceptor domain-containing protein [Telmatospirillum sp. J64-1]
MALFLSCFLILGLLGTWMDYAGSLEQAQAETGALADLLEEHVQRTVQVADLSLQLTEGALAVHGGPAAITTSPQARSDLAEIQSYLPATAALRVTDAEGNVLHVTGGVQWVKPFNIGDRPYFREHLAGSGLVVGEGILGRGTGNPIFTISRRLNAPDGSMAGIAVVVFPVAMLEAFYEKARTLPGSRINLLRVDGRQMAGYPEKALSDEQIRQILKAHRDRPDGLIRERRDKDSDSILSYRSIEGLPLIVTAAVSTKDALAPFYWRLRRNAVLGLLVVLALAAIAALALQRIRAEEQARRDLAIVNATLERRVVERTAALLTARQEAERANEGKSRFLAAASHDLRQPLQGARLFLAVLGERLKDRPADQAIANKASEALQGSQSLLNALLDISALEAGVVTPKIGTVSVAEMLEHLCSEWEPQAAEKGLRLQVVPCRLHVQSDPVLLQRIVRNFLANAVRYTQQGQILLGCRRRGTHLRIDVCDTRPGHPAGRTAAHL